MKRFLSILLLFCAFAASAQHTGATYINSTGQVSSKPIAINGNLPANNKEKYYDNINFNYRPFRSAAEVLSYLQPQQRYQGLKVWVDSCGAFNSTSGVLTPGCPTEYAFDGSLQLKIYIDFGLSSYSVAYLDTLGNDSKAVIGDINHPFKTADAALIALMPYKSRLLEVGIGAFAAWNPANIRSNTTIHGAASGVFENTSTASSYGTYVQSFPTKMIGGSRFIGTCLIPDSIKKNIKLLNCGTDVGSGVISTLYNNVPQEGLLIAAANSHPSDNGLDLRTGINIDNWTVLSVDQNSGAYSNPQLYVHGILVERAYGAKVTNCVVWGSYAALVSKNYYAEFAFNEVHRAAIYGGIDKSNAYAGSYYSSWHDNLFDGGAGMTLHLEDAAAAKGVKVYNNTFTNTNYGVQQQQTGNITLTDISVTGNKFISILGPAINLSDVRGGNISNNYINTSTKGVVISAGRNVNADNNTVINNSSNAYEIASADTNGVLLRGNRGIPVVVSGSSVYGSGNFFVPSSGVIRPTPDFTGVSTNVLIKDTLYAAVTTSDLLFVNRDAAVNYNSGTKAFTTANNTQDYSVANAIDTQAIAANSEGSIDFLWTGNYFASGMLGLSLVNTKPTTYNDASTGPLVQFRMYSVSGGSIDLFYNHGNDGISLPSPTVGNRYRWFRHMPGGNITFDTKTPSGAWTTLVTVPSAYNSTATLYPVFLLANISSSTSVIENPTITQAPVPGVSTDYVRSYSMPDLELGTQNGVTTYIGAGTTNKRTVAVTSSGNMGIGTATPTATLEIASTVSGILIPRMTTTQRNAISSPATSLMIFNTSIGKYNVYSGSRWQSLMQEDLLPEYTDNAAATSAGLTSGMFYRNGDFVKQVHP